MATKHKPYNNEEQRQKWNQYQKSYSSKNYFSLSLKLNRKLDADVIEFFRAKQAEGVSYCDTLKELVRKNAAD